MRKEQLIQGIGCLMVFSVLVSGCAFTAKPSGFLSNYSELNESDETKNLFVSATPKTGSRHYTKLFLEPVTVYFSPDAEGINFDPEDLQELSLYLEMQVIKTFEQDFELTDKPGPGVLTLRTAITDMKSNKFFMNTVPNYTLLSGLGLGAAAVEAEFVDSMSKESLLALRYSRKGKRRKYLKGFSKWGHTKDVLDEWSEILHKEIFKVIE